MKLLDEPPRNSPLLSRAPRVIGAGLSLMFGAFGCLMIGTWWAKDFRGVTAGLFLAVVAIVLGHLCRFKPGYLCGYGCWLALLFVPIILGIAPLFLPGLRTKVTKLDVDFDALRATYATDFLRDINNAEKRYASTYHKGYSPTLSCLGKPLPPGTRPSANAAGLIDIFGGEANVHSQFVYRFVYLPGPPDRKGTISAYNVTATPLEPGATGGKYFYTDETGVIRQRARGPAGSADPPIPR